VKNSLNQIEQLNKTLNQELILDGGRTSQSKNQDRANLGINVLSATHWWKYKMISDIIHYLYFRNGSANLTTNHSST